MLLTRDSSSFEMSDNKLGREYPANPFGSIERITEVFGFE